MLLALFMVLALKRSRVSLSGNSSSPASFANLLSQAKELELKNNLWEAKMAYQKLVNEFLNSPEVMNWQKRIEEINIRLLFSPAVTHKSMLYEIKPGDTLAKI